jgi:hypothetical protein
MKLKALLNKKVVLFVLSFAGSLFGPFLLPPHVEGTYIPLASLLLESDVWYGEADGAFYIIFLAEWVVCFFLLYCVGKLVSKATDICWSH